MRLILLAFLPVLSALSPRGPPPDAAEPYYKFKNLFEKCAELKKFFPVSAASAQMWSLNMKDEKIVIHKLVFNLVDMQIDTKSVDVTSATSDSAIWNHNMKGLGYFLDSEWPTFQWESDEPGPSNQLDLGNTNGTCYGFATEDYVYTQVFQEDGAKKFARWRVDLSGEVEILGDASPDENVLLFQYKFGPAYYLTDQNCLQINDLRQLSDGYKSFRKCNTSQGMFAFSDLYEWYSLSAFAWLTRECDGEIWSNYWAHVFVKIRFLPGYPPAIRRTTTLTPFATTPSSTTTEEEITYHSPCPNVTNIYRIVLLTLAIILVLIGINNVIFCVYMRRKVKEAKLQAARFESSQDSKGSTSTGKATATSTTTATTAADSSTTKISRLATMSSLSSEGLPKDAVTKLLLSPEIEKIFDQNEVEGIEAELPYTPLERQPEPPEGFFCTFGKIGVTIPAKTFYKTFGEFEMEMGGELCTVQFEDVKSELNRIEAMAAVMRQAQKKQINGTIPEFMVTAQLDAFNFRLLVAKKLGPSIEKQVLSGNLSTEERLKLVSLTFNCMEDLLFSNIVHRDIKPSSFHYDFVGSKLLISNLGLARITPKSPRLKLPFFGNLTFCSPSTHLKLERTHFDDMVSYFYVVLWIFKKDLLIWSSETDKTVVYQLKSDLMEGKLLEERLKKFIKHEKIIEFLSQLFRLILMLPPKRPSYRKIKELIGKN
ncbi:unnamed protein product [Bursaphelenchus xylophilus]|uniref:(pine wood nematode) hypothetical protein n=1 Tax=Bursaphelenchus xylophilus TaxID=6326 RepID=A0A1I7RUZ9_BURXY|nr:unnamed protein product [Bursaphelenchus xylophilus]CAG9105257.1 unnamed protein product [Bursaphelenchus xylophilus]